MAQREIGPESVIGTLRASRAEQVEDASPIAGSTMLQRMMIAPLTQLGRRITALTNRVNDRSRKALGNMLLDDELFEKLSKIPHVKNPSRVGQSLHFYGRERNVFFEVLNVASSSTMKDIRIKKLGLQDLMDAKYAKDGIH